MIRDPILVTCEGSGTEPIHHLCPMCGVPLHALGGGALIPKHYRRDILAELQRGDFDPQPSTSTKRKQNNNDQ